MLRNPNSVCIVRGRFCDLEAECRAGALAFLFKREGTDYVCDYALTIS